LIVHPKRTLKTQATKTTAGKLAKSNPYLSQKANFDFLKAHDDLSKAMDDRDIDDDEETAARKENNIIDCQDHVEELERTRQSMQVAWITARHVERVKAVDCIPPPPFPPDSFFEEKDEFGYTEFWSKWIAYVGFNHKGSWKIADTCAETFAWVL